MPFKPGQAKPEGSGMKKGQKTRRSFDAQEIFLKHNFDPLEAVIERLVRDGRGMDEKLFMESCLKIAKFKYAELKSMDLRVNPAELSDNELLEETERLLREAREAAK